MRELCESAGLELSQVVYMDDKMDFVGVLRMVRHSVALAGAIAEVRVSLHHVCHRKRGEGCIVRELVNLALA